MKMKSAFLSLLLLGSTAFAADNATLTRVISKMVIDINNIKSNHQVILSELDFVKKDVMQIKETTKVTDDKLLLTQEELSKTKADIDAKTQGLRDENGNLIGSANAANEKRIAEIRDRLLKIEASLNGVSSEKSTDDVEKVILDYIK